MWALKTYEGRKLLFAGFIGLTFDKSHDMEQNNLLLVTCFLWLDHSGAVLTRYQDEQACQRHILCRCEY
jgi:hypothetical protein